MARIRSSHAVEPLEPLREVRRLLARAARRIGEDARLVKDWEARSLLATTGEVLRCLDEAFERFERRRSSPSRGPRVVVLNHPPRTDADERT